MKKPLLVCLSAFMMLCAGKAQAQTTCGPDALDYVNAKVATIGGDSLFYFAMWPGEKTSTAYVNSSPITIANAFVYGKVATGDPGPAAMQVAVYNVNAQMQPTTQVAGATASLSIAQAANPAYHLFTFTTPVAVTGNFAIVVTNNDTADDFWVVGSDGDPLTGPWLEELSYYDWQGAWEPMPDVYPSIGEGLIIPVVNYTATANFTTPSTTVNVGAPLTFTNTSSSVFSNRRFNLHAFDTYFLNETDSTFVWNFGDGPTNTYSNNGTHTYVTPGVYTVTLTGNISGYLTDCSDNHTMQITVVSSTTLNAFIANPTHVSCFGGSTGSATVTATGGTAPYSYSWSNGANTATATGLAAGTYTVTVTDANSNTATTTVTITQPAAAVSATVTSANVTCNGSANGSATASATGGAGGYTYTWNTTPAQTTATANNLAPGTYTITVTDANGCTDTETATITQPASAVSAAVSAPTNVTCNGGNNGSATASATGGTAPYTYSWSNGVTTAAATNLTAGTHTVTVTDASGCTDTETVTITQPAAIPLTVSAGSSICSGASASLSASGADNYTWMPGNLTGDNITVTPTTTTTYTVTGTANGCSASATSTIVVDALPSTAVTQNQATLTATATGATYQWLDCDNNNSPIAGQTSQSFTATQNGNYAVTIVSQAGCTATSTCYAVTTVGISENAFGASLQVYPNPANNYLDIKGDFAKGLKLVVTDITGKVIVAKEINAAGTTFRLTTSELSEGMYLLTIQSGDSVATKKVMIQK